MTPRSVLRKMGQLGFLGIRYPAAYGGSELDALATVVMAEELGRSTYGGFAITVLVHTDMAGPHLVNSGSAEQYEKYMPGVLSGEFILSIGVSEPDAGSDVAGIRTSAVKDGDGWRIDGAKAWVSNAAIGGTLSVYAQTDPDAGHRGIACFIVDADAPGVIRSRQYRHRGADAAAAAAAQLANPTWYGVE